MNGLAERRFLFIGTTIPETIISRLKANGINYIQKRFDSGPENWRAIAQLLEDPKLLGVVAKLTSTVYKDIVSEFYSEVAPVLLRALAARPHIAFVHEAVLAGEVSDDSAGSEEPPSEAMEEYEEIDEWTSVQDDKWKEPPDPQTLSAASRILDELHINIMPYRTNAELSVMAATFVDNNERNLLFRVYVPVGRLYSAEADKLLGLFRDWLNQVGRHGIRQDGYSTTAGHVYEFFGNESLPVQSLVQQFDDFSDFLNKCIDDPLAAEEGLVHSGVSRLSAPGIVQRYGKEARRLQVDMRHERELRLVTLRHRFESELLDSDDLQADTRQIEQLIERFVPKPDGFSAQALVLGNANANIKPGAVTVNVNQQIVQAAAGAIIHNVQGTAHFGLQANEIISLIKQHAVGQEAIELESAVHELEDADARHTDRLGAKNRIKAFLFRVGKVLEKPALEILQKYIEGKVGL